MQGGLRDEDDREAWEGENAALRGRIGTCAHGLRWSRLHRGGAGHACRQVQLTNSMFFMSSTVISTAAQSTGAKVSNVSPGAAGTPFPQL